ncbi:MAG: hypothetical protein E7299_00240 [Lachnospiraceae bacterium]|nr:hypothetical protein [Lachnospiraceae bacterium]
MSAVPQREEQLNMEMQELLNAETVETREVMLEEDKQEEMREDTETSSDGAASSVKHGENKFAAVLDMLGQKFVYAILAVSFFVFSFYSFKYTQSFKSYEQEYLEAHFDKSLKNVVLFLVLIIISKLVYSLLRRVQGKLKGTEIVLYALCALTFFISAIWVKVSGSMPYGDQAYVCNAAADFVNGVYDCMKPSNYIGMYPHQLSITFFMELIFRVFGIGNYRIFQYLNVVFLVALIYAGYQLTKSLFEKEECQTYYLILMTLCLPILVLYVPYVYGEVGSIAMMLLASWQLVNFCKGLDSSSTTNRNLVWMILFSVAAVLLRKNSLISIIAEVIVLLFTALRKQAKKVALVAVITAIAVWLVPAGITKMYEMRSGMEVGKGVPSITFVAMGMQDGWPGPGWYNNYGKEVYQQAQFDSELAADIAKENLNVRLFHFNANKPAAVEFIKNKLKSQWNEPTYEAFWMNHSFDERISNTELVENVFDGNINSIIKRLMNFTQLAVYGLFTFAMLALLLKKRSMCDCLPAITILGGFLFSIIWEAKSRYVLPYYILMVLYAAYGMHCLHQMLGNTIMKYFASRPEMLDAARIDNDKSLDDATLGGFDDRRDSDKPRKGRIVLFTRRK